MTKYFVDPEVLRKLVFGGATTLKGIEKPRLRALILQDLEIYREASIGELRQRIGDEIPRRRIQRELADLTSSGQILAVGNGRGRKYRIVLTRDESTDPGTIPAGH